MKKKFPLVFIPLFTTLLLNAQYEKGSLVVGGNLNFSTNTRNLNLIQKDLNLLNTTQLQLEAGYAIKKNLVLGGRISYGTVNGNTFYTNGLTHGYGSNPYLSAEVFLRSYMPLSKKLSLFGEASLTRTQGKYYSFGTDAAGIMYQDNMKSRSIILAGSIGLNYKVSDRVSLELALNNLVSSRYSWTKGTRTYASGAPSETIQAAQLRANPFRGLGQNISLGVKIRLGKK
jgi:hypothetical protein